MTQNEYVCAIFCRPEAAGDFISGVNVKTIGGYFVLNFEAASIFPSKSKSAIYVMRRRRLAHLSPIFGATEQKCLIGCTRSNEALELRFPTL